MDVQTTATSVQVLLEPLPNQGQAGAISFLMKPRLAVLIFSIHPTAETAGCLSKVQRTKCGKVWAYGRPIICPSVKAFSPETCFV